MSVKETNFESNSNKHLFKYILKISIWVVKQLCYVSVFFKHTSMATGNFWSYCDQSLAGLCLFTEVRYRISQKKCSENFIEYFTSSKNGMAKYVSTQNFFHVSKFQHSHKKRNDSLETRVVMFIFLLELEISGVAVQSLHQNCEKWWILWGIA